MSGSNYSLITCPGCQRSLPPNAQQCQFCGASLEAVPRAAPAQKAKYRKGVEPWVMTLFYICAVYWILEGLYWAGTGIAIMVQPVDPLVSGVTQTFGGIAVAIGAFIALLGVGLLMKWEWCRGVVNVFCWLRILGGLWRLKSLIFGGLFMSPAMLISGFFFTIVGLIAAGVQVWLLSETD